MSKVPETTQEAPSGGESRSIGLGLSLDINYVKSIPGILTAAITLLSLVAFICVEAGRNDVICNYLNAGAYGFFGFVSMSAFLTGLINYLLFLFMIYQKLGMVPWNLAILIWSAVWAVLYLIASAVAAARSCGQGGIITGAVFGFILMLLLGGRAFFAFKEFRSQRSGDTSQQTAPPPQEYPQAPHY